MSKDATLQNLRTKRGLGILCGTSACVWGEPILRHRHINSGGDRHPPAYRAYEMGGVGSESTPHFIGF